MPHRRSERHPDETASRRHPRRTAADRHGNGVTEAGTAATGEQPEASTTQEPAETSSDQSATRRAEELVDQWGERIGRFASQAGQRVLRWAARAREGAEDIWAEAQSIRRGEHETAGEPGA